MNIKDIKLDECFKILLTGPNGVGKSIAAGSFHEAGPIHFDDFDGRMKPVANHYRNSGADIEYTSYGIDDFRGYLDWIEGLQTRKPNFKTLVTDSLSSLSMTCIMWQLTSKQKIKTGKAGLPATSWDEINGETVLIGKILEIFKILNENFKINIIMTSHPFTKTQINIEEGGEEKTKVLETLIAYGNKIGFIAPGYFDEIYRLKMKKTGINSYSRIAVTSLANDDQIVAKTALSLPPEIDITKGMYKAILENIGKGK